MPVFYWTVHHQDPRHDRHYIPGKRQDRDLKPTVGRSGKLTFVFVFAFPFPSY
jgi:hypothetical protein